MTELHDDRGRDEPTTAPGGDSEQRSTTGGPIRAVRELLGQLRDAVAGGDAGSAPKQGWEVKPPEPEEIRQDGVDKPRPLPGDQPPPK